MIFTPTKVMLVFCWALFVALFCWIGATDAKSPIPNPKIKPHQVDENSGAFQKEVEKNGWGPEGTEELMANIQSKVVKGGPKGEEELVISNPIHYRTKRSGPLSWSKYIFDMSIKKYTKEK